MEVEREKNEKALNKTNRRGRRILETRGEVANGKFLCPSPYPKQPTLSAGDQESLAVLSGNGRIWSVMAGPGCQCV